jgi:anti-sigma factor RsiW
MTVSDETLMAYADGEVDAATRAIIEAAIRDDPQVRSRIAQHRALRQAMQGAFSEVLDEPVPQRLIDAARAPIAARGPIAAPASNVVDLAAARSVAADHAPGRLGRWRPTALAASLLVGLALGYFAWHGATTLVSTSPSGELVASAGLAEALSNQLSADRAPGLVATTGLSFRTKTGDYCRTFSLNGSHTSSGLACREAGSWKIKVLAQSPHAAANSANFRPAGSADAPAVRAAVEESIDGEPLDQAAEIAARQRGWSATPRHIDKTY